MRKNNDSPEDYIQKLVAGFCDICLTPEYRDCAFHLIDLIRANSSLNLNRGRAEIWAAAILSVIGRVNSVCSVPCHDQLRLQNICDFFQVKSGSAGGKATLIARTLDLRVGQEGISIPIMRELTKSREKIGVIVPVSRADTGVNDGIKRLGNTIKRISRAANAEAKKARVEEQAERKRRIEKKKRLRREAEEAQLGLFDDSPRVSDKDE